MKRRPWPRGVGHDSMLDAGRGLAIVSAVESEVFEAFRDLGVSEEKALKAASALSKRDQEVGGLKAEVSTIKWMLATNLTLSLFALGILVKMISH